MIASMFRPVTARGPLGLLSLPLLAATLAPALLAGCAHSGPPEVVRLLDGAPHRGPYIPPESYEAFVRAELAFEAGDWQGAAAGYREALEGSPDEPLAAARLAESLEGLGEPEEADETIDDALRAHPEAEALWMARGRIADARDEPALARGAFERAMRAAPRSEEPPLALVRLLLGSGGPEEVESHLENIASQSGSSPDSLLRARLLLALRFEDAEGAASVILAMTRRGQPRRDEIAAAAELALRSEKSALAAELIDLAPSDEEHAALRVRIYRAVGRDREAAALLMPSVRPDPDSAQYSPKRS